ncbi:hypothetical protein [Aquimarina spongiae]|uniref:Uncharacterized protein n=1 Tax=Aquimarina spongiae TaxID=570521 RepID=A0A1M6GDZ7_9FLAO|nr:hypothetical protein [Aquimarina spongiae]SHJ08166.1 hypothetical protein SAMN04488508_105227 [Aquimarina spongiae]
MIAVLEYFLGTITLFMPSSVEVEGNATVQSFSQGNLQVVITSEVESTFRSITGENSVTIIYKNI